MKHKVPDGVEVWKQFEDLLIPGLRLSVIERAVYSHLLRHSRLEGKQRLQFSIHWLARGAGLGVAAARGGVRRLAAKGALRLAEKSKRGHTIEVRLPAEVRGLRARKTAGRGAKRLRGAANLKKADFQGNRALREAIHAREDGYCFYCLRRVTSATRCLDHIHSAGEDGMELLSQPGIELLGMQFTERGAAGGRFPAVAVPRGPIGEQRTQGAAASAGEDGGREDAACGEWQDEDARGSSAGARRLGMTRQGIVQ